MRQYLIPLLSLVIFDCISCQINPDVGLNSVQLITTHNYPLSNHTVYTKDGYILKMHHIPHGQNTTVSTKGPVLLLHGIQCDSSVWVNHGTRSLAFILADLGHDVWLANFRGNIWSRNHTSFSVTSYSFWNFSFHEMGIYDLSAMIDYILSYTGWANLHIIGHSLGTTTAFVLTSEVPLYNSKIKLLTSLAPVAFMSHATSPALYYLKLNPWILSFCITFGYYQYETCPYVQTAQSTTCPGCFFMFYAAGYDETQMESNMTPVIETNIPAGASVKLYQHFLQEYISGNFSQYDYGSTNNMNIYNSLTPPNYNLTRVTVPVALNIGPNDTLASTVDVSLLSKKLANVVVNYTISYPSFNHLDFLWARDVEQLAYNGIIANMMLYP